MNWFWLRRHRRIPSAGDGLPHGSTGRRTRRPGGSCAPGSAWWSRGQRPGALVRRAAPGRAGPPRRSPRRLLISRTAPDAPVGRQLTWFLRAMADIPWSPQVIRAHFDSGFLAQVSPAQVNSDLENLPAVAASLTGLLWQDPARDPVALLAVADFGGQQLTVEIAVDRAGLISGLLLTPYQPRRPAGPRSTGTLRRWLPTPACWPPGSHRAGPAPRCTRWPPRPPGRWPRCSSCSSWARSRTRSPPGQVSWNQDLTVTAALKSGGSGSLQDVPAGTRVSVRQTALQMISISDNTAADMLIHLVGRSAVQAQDRQWSAHAALNVPFLTTREALPPEIPRSGAGAAVPAPGPGPARGVPGLLGGPAAVQPGTTAKRGHDHRPQTSTPSNGSPRPMTSAAPSPDCSSSRPSPRWHRSVPSCRPTTAASGLTRRSGPRSGTRAAPSRAC